jgi:hypothetical protein
MKFTIEVEDFYLEEGELSHELKNYVTSQVKKEIWKTIQEKVEKQIEMRVRETVESEMYRHINNCLSESIKDVKLKYNGKDVPVSEYIVLKLQETGGWNTLAEHITKLGKAHAAEFTKRYDQVFAMSIVDSMAKNNYLNDQAVKVLTANK